MLSGAEQLCVLQKHRRHQCRGDLQSRQRRRQQFPHSDQLYHLRQLGGGRRGGVQQRQRQSGQRQRAGAELHHLQQRQPERQRLPQHPRHADHHAQSGRHDRLRGHQCGFRRLHHLRRRDALRPRSEFCRRGKRRFATGDGQSGNQRRQYAGDQRSGHSRGYFRASARAGNRRRSGCHRVRGRGCLYAAAHHAATTTAISLSGGKHCIQRHRPARRGGRISVAAQRNEPSQRNQQRPDARPGDGHRRGQLPGAHHRLGGRCAVQRGGAAGSEYGGDAHGEHRGEYAGELRGRGDSIFEHLHGQRRESAVSVEHQRE